MILSNIDFKKRQRLSDTGTKNPAVGDDHAVAEGSDCLGDHFFHGSFLTSHGFLLLSVGRNLEITGVVQAAVESVSVFSTRFAPADEPTGGPAPWLGCVTLRSSEMHLSYRAGK